MVVSNGSLAQLTQTERGLLRRAAWVRADPSDALSPVGGNYPTGL